MVKLPVNVDLSGSWGGLYFSDSTIIDVYDSAPSAWSSSEEPTWGASGYTLNDLSYYFSGSYAIPAPTFSDSPLAVTSNIIGL